MNNRLKEIFLGIIALLTYFVLSMTESLPFELAGVDIQNISTNIKLLYMFIYEVLILCLILLIFNKKIKKDFDDILKNHKTYYSKSIKYYLVGLIIMVFSNTILALLTNGGIAGNEETVRAMFKMSPVYMYISAVLFAPVVEELVFRQGIRNICGKNIIFIIVSGFLFGGLHVMSSISTTLDLFYIIPYSALGVVFAIMLYKTDNIFVSMGFHFMHNGILMAIQLMTFLI
ncbi:MAG: CPBP family intramembrane metalloprotease [Bacilli bacterium]|nr:CPBP family intramembrane metalloprotease [Bacilli bacterium]